MVLIWSYCNMLLYVPASFSHQCDAEQKFPCLPCGWILLNSSSQVSSTCFFRSERDFLMPSNERCWLTVKLGESLHLGEAQRDGKLWREETQHVHMYMWKEEKEYRRGLNESQTDTLVISDRNNYTWHPWVASNPNAFWTCLSHPASCWRSHHIEGFGSLLVLCSLLGIYVVTWDCST